MYYNGFNTPLQVSVLECYSEKNRGSNGERNRGRDGGAACGVLNVEGEYMTSCFLTRCSSRSSLSSPSSPSSLASRSSLASPSSPMSIPAPRSRRYRCRSQSVNQSTHIYNGIPLLLCLFLPTLLPTLLLLLSRYFEQH